jgi:hypothetical protein
MEISTKTIANKTGLEIEALIIAAVKSGVTNFTSDLPLDIFDPSLIGTIQIDADGTWYEDNSGFNVGEWDLVAARVTAEIIPAIEARIPLLLSISSHLEAGMLKNIVQALRDGMFLNALDKAMDEHLRMKGFGGNEEARFIKNLININQ